MSQAFNVRPIPTENRDAPAQRFTPGPWEVWDRNRIVSQDRPPRLLAEVTVRDGSEANARLIAAAPDLYAVAVSVINFFKLHEAFGDFASLTSCAGAFGPIERAARAAIESCNAARQEPPK